MFAPDGDLFLGVVQHLCKRRIRVRPQHRDPRLDPVAGRGEGDGLRVVAGAVGDDPAAPFLVAEVGDRVQGTTSLEGADVLEVLRLEPELRPRDRVVRYEVDVRRFSQLSRAGASLAIGDATLRVDGEAIYTIRKQLSGIGVADGLRFVNDHYALGEPAALWRDVDELDRWLGAARQAAAEGDVDRQVDA